MCRAEGTQPSSIQHTHARTCTYVAFIFCRRVQRPSFLPVTYGSGSRPLLPFTKRRRGKREGRERGGEKREEWMEGGREIRGEMDRGREKGRDGEGKQPLNTNELTHIMHALPPSLPLSLSAGSGEIHLSIAISLTSITYPSPLTSPLIRANAQ